MKDALFQTVINKFISLIEETKLPLAVSNNTIEKKEIDEKKWLENISATIFNKDVPSFLKLIVSYDDLQKLLEHLPETCYQNMLFALARIKHIETLKPSQKAWFRDNYSIYNFLSLIKPFIISSAKTLEFLNLFSINFLTTNIDSAAVFNDIFQRLPVDNRTAFWDKFTIQYYRKLTISVSDYALLQSNCPRNFSALIEAPHVKTILSTLENLVAYTAEKNLAETHFDQTLAVMGIDYFKELTHPKNGNVTLPILQAIYKKMSATRLATLPDILGEDYFNALPVNYWALTQFLRLFTEGDRAKIVGFLNKKYFEKISISELFSLVSILPSQARFELFKQANHEKLPENKSNDHALALNILKKLAEDESLTVDQRNEAIAVSLQTNKNIAAALQNHGDLIFILKFAERPYNKIQLLNGISNHVALHTLVTNGKELAQLANIIAPDKDKKRDFIASFKANHLGHLSGTEIMNTYFQNCPDIESIMTWKETLEYITSLIVYGDKPEEKPNTFLYDDPYFFGQPPEKTEKTEAAAWYQFWGSAKEKKSTETLTRKHGNH